MQQLFFISINFISFAASPMWATLAFWIQSSCMSEQLLVPNSAEE